MSAPQWRMNILAELKQLLRREGFHGSRARFWKRLDDRVFYVQLFGGSDPHDINKLDVQLLLGVDFLSIADGTCVGEQSAYLALWSGWTPCINSAGVGEKNWRAYCFEETLEVLRGLKTALPLALATMESRFQSWHDVLVYLDKESGVSLDPPGRVNEYKLPLLPLP